jgi:hypothetical protein|tara:strand:+ start:245 stop:580 length:336 start_codon:yes stop_codon:yes gene_type:complete
MKSFLDYLEDKVFPTEDQKRNEIWDVEGRIRSKNQSFKFDIRPLKIVDKDRSEKIGYFKSKSDKMVFENINQWIIFDTEELNEYVKSSNKKDFNIDELIDNLSWNLIIDKN